jgi:hypothetical protein
VEAGWVALAVYHLYQSAVLLRVALLAQVAVLRRALKKICYRAKSRVAPALNSLRLQSTRKAHPKRKRALLSSARRSPDASFKPHQSTAS